MNDEPVAELTRRRDLRAATATALETRQGRIAGARGLTALAAVALVWMATVESVSAAWMGLPGVVFLALVVAHARVIAARARAERSRDWYALALARLDGTWPGHGATGERFADPAHPYARDLDLFGTGSLFQLLSTARTQAGEATLAVWLGAPGSASEVRARQGAVVELAPALDLREALALAGEDVRADVDPGRLSAWGRGGHAPPAVLRGLLAAVAAVALGVVLAWAAGIVGGRLLFTALGLEGAVALLLRARVRRVLAGVDLPAHALGVLAAMLQLVEQADWHAPLLCALRNRLRREGAPPSARIAHLRRLVQLLDARRNQLFAPVGWLLLWTTQTALAIEQWRTTCGGEIGDWLAALGDVEALASLGAHAYGHPDDVMPEVVEAEAVVEARGLAHPLLPVARAVRNDLVLDGTRPLLLVSGSNMSGKSTWLRAVGTNVVLALAGAPVRAHAFRVAPLALGAAIHVEDSLLDGRSRFYAEILRLRAIVDLAAGPRPVLFLLDEILAGTNSHDRRLGAEAIVRGLVARGALGLVTTHDLALAAIVDGLGPRAANVHFADELVDGQLRFDYRLRPGVVARSNALALMRAVGLSV